MKKVIKTLLLTSTIGTLFTSCFSLPKIHEQPYEKSVEITTQEDFTDQFEFTDKAYDRTGYVYHYLKSNQDGTTPCDVWIYYPDQFHSESFKIYPSSKIQGFLDCICAEYDKDNFQFKTITGKGITKKGKVKVITTGSKADYIRKTVVGKKEIITPLGIAPSYDINFDLADMNSMLPFLKHNDKDFVFGLTNIKREHLLGKVEILYLGKMNCEYTGQENYKNKNCNVFNMVLQNFEHISGKIYIDPETNDLIEINTEHCGNPFFTSLKFTLLEKYKTTPEEWESFMKKKAADFL